MSEKNEEELTIQEVVKLTGISRQTLNARCKANEIPGAHLEIQKNGSFWLIPRSSIPMIIKRGKGRPPKDETSNEKNE